MIVQCPYCATRYKLDEARLVGTSPRLKCSRCTQLFPAPVSKKRPAAVPPKPAAPPSENLTLPFEEAAWKDGPDVATAPEVVEDEFEISDTNDTYTLGTDEEAPLPPQRMTREPAVERVRRPRARRHDDADDDSALGHRDRERGKFRAILIFLAMTVTVYAVVARALLASPTLTDRFLRSVPLIGNTFGSDRLMARKLALADVTGSYQRIKDGKEVFVISGKALNTAPVALQGVQIAGKLLDNRGQLIDQKVIYCGNVISAKVLKDLTPRELSILQQLSPPKHFMIEPGESSTFVIVFMDPPRGAVEYSAQVVAAQRQA